MRTEQLSKCFEPLLELRARLGSRLTGLQLCKQQFSNSGVLNASITVVKMWKLTFPVQYF